MSDDRRLEEQIKHFYDNVPDVKDALPLKDYLLKHENNQMAWYLLGKQYAAKGEEGKANYCFAQAGAVYEAFESKANPLLAAAHGRQPRPARRRFRLAAAAGLLLLALGLLLPGGQAQAPGPNPAAPASGGAAASESPNAAGEAAPASPSAAPPAAPGAKLAYVAGAAAAGTDGPAAVGQLLTATNAPSSSLLVQTPVLDKKWTDWVRSGKPVAAVSGASVQAAAGIVWYDSGWCPCGTGQDSGPVRKTVASWKPLQEGKLALRSAMIRFRERTGKWPSSKADLAGAYPANMLAGWSEAMTPWLSELTEELAKGEARTAAALGWPNAGGPSEGNGKPAGKLAAIATEPLEIVVDKRHHRLAVVSGNVLLRNYEVGLGGDKTPEGRFVITEKVRDPNGRFDGPFGSRGMTLSDTLYAIHGTDEPDSIGKDESNGCIRMNAADLEELYDLVPLGTPVTIAKEGLPSELRVPSERFRLAPEQNETNPHKRYNWLN
ncbi:L,D-transpeptidase [Cohnella thermotolerans]|uniref:L,D-transpeptidase n=1 Tax=Cohnella thermotolerans TaxID=329858 RepID=UPI0003FB5785|nr:L,D-transpeptidase [Cohnella thermotolerans]